MRTTDYASTLTNEQRWTRRAQANGLAQRRERDARRERAMFRDSRTW